MADDNYKIKYLEDKINNISNKINKIEIEIMKFTPWCVTLTALIIIIFICIKK